MSQFLKLGTIDLTDHVYGEIKTSGGGWKIKQDGAVSLATSARKDSPEGAYVSFDVVFGSESEASRFLLYCSQNSPESSTFDEDVGVDQPLYIRSRDYYYRVWGIVAKPQPLNKSVLDYTQYSFDVTCYLYSPYSYSRLPYTWVQSGITSLPVTKAISNRNGHIPSSFESLAITCTYNSAHVKNLVLSNAKDGSLPICDEALSGEVWEVCGNENTILETYEDLIAANITQFTQDVTNVGSCSFTTGDPAIGWVQIPASDAPYYKLSGPNPLRYPVKLTTSIIQDGACSIEISDDPAGGWTELFNEDDFYAGSDPNAVNPIEYILDGTEYMTDCYVRFRCDSGNMWLGNIKFECERWVEHGAMPMVEAGDSDTYTIDATTGSEYVSIDGDFYVRRLFI